MNKHTLALWLAMTACYLKALALIPAGSGLEGASWLKATDTPAGGGALTIQVDVDLTVLSGAPAIFFGWTADRAYFQWQLIADAPVGPVLRRCVRTFTDNPPYEDVRLNGFDVQDILGRQIHLCIEATGRDVTTYIDGRKVDTYRCSRATDVGPAGFCVMPGDDALVDNFELRLSHPNGKSRVIVSDDFSGTDSLCFPDAVVADGQCLIKALAKEYKLPTMDECYPTFYRFFNTRKRVASATLHASALGVYDLWINGQRVGTPTADGHMVYDEMKPGWTDYNHRVTYNTYDVTDLCREGENSVGAIVSPGWLGRISRSQYKWPLSMAFIARLEVLYTDGTSDVIVTDEQWSTEKYSPILRSDIYNGECYDGRRTLPWADKAWAMPCKPQIFDYPGVVEPLTGPTIQTVDELILSPVNAVVYADITPGIGYGSIIEKYRTDGPGSIDLKAGETAILDFGQNCTGVPEITVNGQRSTHLHMRFGEMLNDSGDPDHGNDGPAGSLYTANLRAAKAEVRYALRGGDADETYSPTSTFFGYRYCTITADRDISIKSVKTRPWSSAHILTGSVTTDNEDINRLYENIRWSQLSNFVSVPIDCPQRDERLGWTADAQLFATTAMYNARTGEFYRKWLQDIRDAQRDDGAYADVVPLSLVKYGSAGWADAGIVVPWQIYMMTGDTEAVAEHYASMERYMDWLATLDDDGLKHPGAYTTYGDLFAPHAADKRFVSQAYYYYDTVLMARMSRLLSAGDDDDFSRKARRYDALAAEIKYEMQGLYFDENGLTDPTQSGCVIALHFGLYTDNRQRQSIADTLAQLVRQKGHRLDTGFISTAYILQALCDNGYVELAYDLLTQHEYPSWLYMVDNGATTIWENWYCYRPEKGFSDVKGNSFNHYGLGSFGSWLYSHMAGIAPCEEQPGFERVVFAPCIDTRTDRDPSRMVTSASASYLSAHGSVSASWRLADDGALTYDIDIPSGAVGELRLPLVSSTDQVWEGGNPVEARSDIQYIGYRDGRKIYTLAAGTYSFSTAPPSGITDAVQPVPLKVWPNPATSAINISTGEEVSALTITSMSGQNMISTPGGITTIDVSSLPSGPYLLHATTPTGSRTALLIKR